MDSRNSNLNTGVRQRTRQDRGRRVPVAANLLLALLVIAVDTGFLVAAAPVSSAHPGYALIALAAFVLVTPTHWGLIHEGIHGRLASGARTNRAASRVMSQLFGFAFDVVQFGHLTHHRFNGHANDRPDRIKPGESISAACLRHYGHLLGGHYLFTALVGVLAFTPAGLRKRLLTAALPRPDVDTRAILESCIAWFSSSQRLARTRVDILIALAWIVVGVLGYGTFWPLLVAGLIGRAIVFSVLDNLPHYGVPGRGNQAARDFRLHPWASTLVLGHNLHRVHHEHVELPWTALTEGLASEPAQSGYFGAALRQFGPPTRY
jgi:fatty acid desaturase